MGFNLGEFLNLNNKSKKPQPASTAQAVAPRMQYSPVAQQRIMARNPQGGAQQIARGVNTVGQMPTLQQPNLFKQNAQALGLGAARTGLGLVQGVSGLVDLASPGTGTSRVSKAANNLAVKTDKAAQHAGVNAGYKVIQAPLNVATFLTPGAVAEAAGFGAKAAQAVPRVGKVAQFANQLATHGAPGRIAGATVKGTLNKGNVLNAAGMTALQTGTEASKGGKTTPLGTAENFGLNVAFGGGLAGGGQLTKEGAVLAAKGGKATANAAYKAVVPHYAGLPAKQVIMDTQKLDTLHAALQNPTNVESRQNIINGLHQIKDEHGLDFITGTPNQKNQRIAQYLEQNGEAIPQLQAKMARPSVLSSQAGGGTFNIPGGRKNAVDAAKRVMGDDKQLAVSDNPTPFNAHEGLLGFGSQKSPSRTANRLPNSSAVPLGDVPVSSKSIAQAKNFTNKDLSYYRNPEQAPNAGSRFGQDAEPAGKYINLLEEGQNPATIPANFEKGTVNFKKPLVIDFGGGYGDATNWKAQLSKQYGGKTGKALTDAIKKDGHDGIVTVDKGVPQEVVSLQSEGLASKLGIKPLDQGGGGTIKNPFYRGGGEGSMPRGMTAKDVLEYETKELGNADVKPVAGIDLSKIKSENLQWVTKDKASASEYGKVSQVDGSNSRVVATDGQGGYLVEKLPNKPQTAPQAPVPGQKIADSSEGSIAPLAQEALKHKTVGEFEKSLNAMKSGTVTGVGQLPIGKINKTQIKALTERGLPHTDTNMKVSDFKPGRQVTQPLEVYSKGGSWVVENGNHRLAQALANGDTHVPVVFKRGEGKAYATKLEDFYNQAHAEAQPTAPVSSPSTKLVPPRPSEVAPAPRPVTTKLVAAPSESSLVKNTRGFTKNVDNNNIDQNPTAQAVVDAMPGYRPIKNKNTINRAAQTISSDPEAAFARIITKPQLTSADDVAQGQLLLRQAVESGDVESAIQVGTKLGMDGTKLGQAVQAYAMWKKTSPEGILGYAAKKASKNGKTLDVAHGQRLIDEAKRIAAMPEGLERAKATRVLLGEADKLGKNWTTNLSEILSVPRALMATADFSAPLRQGAVLGSRYPKEFGKAFVESAKYMFNPKYYEKEMYELTQRSRYPLMKSSKLSVDAGENLTGTEEQFLSSVLEGKVAKKLGVGHIIAGSDRAYSGFLTKLRADVFDHVMDNAQNAGVRFNQKEIESLSKFINSASGRGDGVTTRQISKLQVLFSARLWKSRLDTLNPLYYARLEPQARKLALQSAASFAAITTTLLALAKANGAEVGADPRSADFGKIKVGNTRYDILGGHQQNIRYAAQMITGKKIDSTTGEVQTIGDGYTAKTRKDITYDMFENKENPLIAFATKNLSTKKDKDGNTTDEYGQPFNRATEAAKLAIPLNAQSVYSAYQDNGNLPKAIAKNVPGTFGVGVQTYGATQGFTKDQKEQYRDLPPNQREAFSKATLAKNKGEAVAKKTGDTSKLSAVDKLTEDKKNANAKLKKSLSAEDYKLSKLSKADRQKLIDSGAYTQKKFDGLDAYIERQKAKLGIATKTKTAKAKSTGRKSTGRKSTGGRSRGASNTAFADALRSQNAANRTNDRALRNLVARAKVSSKSGKQAKVAGVNLKKQNKSKYKSKVKVA